MESEGKRSVSNERKEMQMERKQREEALNVSTVEIETEDKKKLIDVIIDGELYGPVYQQRSQLHSLRRVPSKPQHGSSRRL